MTTIVLAHPWHGSFNKAIFDEVIESLENKGKTYQIIDLNKEGFNPVMTESELALFSKGKYSDPLVGKYQEILKITDELIFIFPIWWFNIPAILKGFFDKIMLKNFAYKEVNLGLQGLLTHIQKTTVITTSNSPKIYIQLFGGNPIKGGLIKRVFKDLGIRNVSWFHCGDTKKEALNKRKAFIEKVKREI